MWTYLSQEEKRKIRLERNGQFYRPPDVRQKDRFNTEEKVDYASSNDASIDKFDYLLVFPLMEGPYALPEVKSNLERISWDTASYIWYKGIPGIEEDKQKGIDNLRTFWTKRVGLVPKEGDEILVRAWKSIAREAIIDTLSKKSGLNLKVTANTESVFVRIRAPIKLLELQADKDNYRFQFRSEIDPGCEEFWNVELERGKDKDGKVIKYAPELEEEKILYSKNEANTILERLYKAGKISPNELMTKEEETQVLFSRRIHALERIADKVPVYNRYPAFCAFSSDPSKRYLYETYPSVRGRTVFRSKDRLFLTKSILDEYFDLEVYKEFEVLTGFMALHDANRGDKLTIDILAGRWLTFWSTTAKEAGAPKVSSEAYEEDVDIEWYLRPFSQPLADIREYFGEKVALYFAWLGFYTYMLTFPAITGMLMVALYIVRGFEYTYGHFDWFLIGFVVSMVAWSAVYKQGWDRECSIIATKWGTKGFEDEEKDRPQFVGDEREPLRRSFVNNRRETYFPEERRRWLVFGSWIAIVLLIILDCAVFAAIFYAEVLVFTKYQQFEFPYFTWAVAFFIALMIGVCADVFRWLARMLTDSENHKTDTEYEDSMIQKTLVFTLFNYFGVLMFTAYVKPNSDLLGECVSSCIDDLKQLLWAIFILRQFVSAWEIIKPAGRQYIDRVFYHHDDEVPGEGSDKVKLIGEPDDNVRFLEESELDEYEGTFDNYAEAVIQFGYVSLFSVVIPYIGFIAIIENLLKIRLDAWKLCTFYQRPHVGIAEDVGTWSTLMDIMSILGIINSVTFICFAEDELVYYTFYEKIIIFLVSEQALLGLKYFIQYQYPSEPDWIEEIDARNEYVIEKYFKGYDDDDDALDFDVIKGTFDNKLDVEGLGLYDLRKSKKISEEDYNALEKLESRKRGLLRELGSLKEQLQFAYKTEHFNDATGIGESKFGLPLGRLNIRVVTVKFDEEDLPLLGTNPEVCIRVNIKATRAGGPEAGPPIGPNSYSKTFKPKAEQNDLNQNIGPFAPIRTQDADVYFDLLDMRPNQNQASLGTVSIRLRDLQDQETHDQVLILKLRDANGQLIVSKSSVYLTMLFQYSKVAPIRAKIYTIQDKLRVVEKEITRIKSGREKEDDPAADPAL